MSYLGLPYRNDEPTEDDFPEFVTPRLLIDYLQSVRTHDRIEEITNIVCRQYDDGWGMQPSILIKYSAQRNSLKGEIDVNGVYETTLLSIISFAYDKMLKH